MVLVLTSDDVESILTINDTISLLEKSFIELSRKQVNMTDRDVFVLEDKNGWFGIMTAHMKNMAALGTKLVTVFPKNIEINKPTTQAVISLIDVNTGEITEFVNEDIEKLQKKVAEKLGYKLVDHRLELYGSKIKK